MIQITPMKNKSINSRGVLDFRILKKALILVFIYLFSFPLNAQTLRGRVISSGDNSPLPYASIYTKSGQFAFSNDNGYFTIKGKTRDQLTITFLGYRDTIITEFLDGMVIKMINDGITTDEIVISDKNYISPYKTLAKARKRYKKESSIEIDSKLFAKRKSVNNGEWADQTEVLYNYKHKNRRIYDWQFKHGKSYVNTQNDIILTLDLFTALKDDWIFDKKIKFLYESILSHSSEKKMAKNYVATYNEFTSNGKEYYVVKSTPIDTNLGYTSTITVNKETDDFVEIQNTIVDPGIVKFKSIRTGKQIDMKEMSLTYKFEQIEGLTFLSHIDVEYSYNLNHIKSVNTLAFHFYDHNQPFQENITDINYKFMTDYQKIWATPYSEVFWNEQNITESELDTLTNFLLLDQKVQSFLKQKQYLTLNEAREVGTEHFEHVPRRDDLSEFKIKPDEMSIKSNLHLNAFFHINAYSIVQGHRIEVTPVINHIRSFIANPTPLVIKQFKDELKILEDVTTEFRNEIEEKYALERPNLDKLVSMKEKYNQKLWSALSKKDNYQFSDWTPYNHLDKLEGNLRRRF